MVGPPLRAALLGLTLGLASCAVAVPDPVVPASMGFITIDATPPTAEVRLDGRLLGPARQLMARAIYPPPGWHSVEIIAPGFRPYVARFLLEPETFVAIRAVLRPAPAP